MFILSECILFLLMLFYDSIWLKYLSIFLCFLYTLIHKGGYGVFALVLLADYCLLIHDYYEMGLFIFIIIQCYYHEIIGQHHEFYILLFLCFYPTLYMLGLCYGCMSLFNLIRAYQQRHWLFVTLLLLGICDVFIVIQFITNDYVPLIWIAYLPSQVYFAKKVLSVKKEPL